MSIYLDFFLIGKSDPSTITLADVEDLNMEELNEELKWHLAHSYAPNSLRKIEVWLEDDESGPCFTLDSTQDIEDFFSGLDARCESIW